MPHDGWHPHDDTAITIIITTARRRGGPCWRQRRCCRSAPPAPRRVDAAQRIADAANRFLALARRRPAPEGDDRLRVRPTASTGTTSRAAARASTLGEMRPNQADAARALFASVLNQRGLELLDGVRLLEGVLREQQGSFRDPDRYCRLGVRHARPLPWGWRFEGHHLSLNVALPAAGHVAVTPFFAGAHPATVRDGPQQAASACWAASEDLARQIMAGLNDPQRQTALDRQPLVRRDRGEPAARAGSRQAARACCWARWTAPSAPVVEALMDRFLATLDAPIFWPARSSA